MILTPRSLDEALDQLSIRPDARPVAGGTDLLVRWPERSPERGEPLLDLLGVPELRGAVLQDDELVLGATTTFWDLLMDDEICGEFPLLAAAARQTGSVQIQTRATWGGNVANASPAADGVMALLACDAVVELRSASDTAVIPLTDFYTGYRQPRMTSRQLITALRIPRRSRRRTYFEKVGSRRAQTISKVGLALCETREGWRVAVNAMAPTVRRCRTLEAALASTRCPSTEAEWIDLIRSDLTPIDDLRSTRGYRERVLARLLLAWSQPEDRR